MCDLDDFSGLILCENHRNTLTAELEMWHRNYLPAGRSVLDLGAGCGETVMFYLNHGAENVLAVEGNSECFRNLAKNFGGDGRVSLHHIMIDHLKVDIEGGEKGMIIETHFPFRLKQRAALRVPGAFGARLWRLEEDWGNILTRALRKLGLNGRD